MDHLDQSRILVQSESHPLLGILLSMAETVVNSGAVSNPLEYYKELANQSSPWIALPEQDRIPCVKIYQISSRGVKKLTAALTLCRQGVRSRRDESIPIVILISTPAGSIPSYLALLAQTVRLLEPRAQREALLESNSPEEAWEFLCQLESGLASSPNP